MTIKANTTNVGFNNSSSEDLYTAGALFHAVAVSDGFLVHTHTLINTKCRVIRLFPYTTTTTTTPIMVYIWWIRGTLSIFTVDNRPISRNRSNRTGNIRNSRIYGYYAIYDSAVTRLAVREDGRVCRSANVFAVERSSLFFVQHQKRSQPPLWSQWMLIRFVRRKIMKN